MALAHLLARGSTIYAVDSDQRALEGIQPRSFELVNTQTTPSGILINSYEVLGPLKASSTHN
jgi:hypothetical protein